MASIFGYIRTSRQLQEGVPGMDPASQELQLCRAGVPQANLFRDIGVSGSTGTRELRAWHHLNERLAGRDTLVVVAIDRIGRTGRVLALAGRLKAWSPHLSQRARTVAWADELTFRKNGPILDREGI